MPRKYIKKKPPPEYSVEDVANAVRDVQNKNMTLAQASTHYGVPKSTINDRVGARVALGPIGAGRPFVFNRDTEDELAGCLAARAKIGIPCGREEFKDLIQEYVQSNNIQTPFKDGRPGQDWYLAFMKRHSQLSLKKAEQLQKARVDARDPEVVYDFFKELDKLYAEKGIALVALHALAFLFNCDESGMPHDPTKSKGIGEKGVALSRISGGSGRENTSVLACVSADGSFLPPLIIFKGAAVQGRWISQKSYPGTTYAASSNGWMEEPVFFSWFTDSFIPYVLKLRVEKNLPNQAAVLIYDGHSSHYSIRIIKAARENNISLVKLPSHITDKLQPLDKSVFGPLKKKWEPLLVEYARGQVGIGHGRLTKDLFSEYLGKVWGSGMQAKNIISGFQNTGLLPLNSSKLSEALFTQDQLNAYHNKQLRKLKRKLALNKAPTAVSPSKRLRLEPGPSKDEESTSTSSTSDQSPETPPCNDKALGVTEGIIITPTFDPDLDESVALDLSLHLHGSTPEKPTSLVDIFTRKIRAVPKRQELTQLKEKTPEQIARLKNLRYGEVLTTDQVLKRLEDAEEAKRKKKAPKKSAGKKATKKKKEDADEENLEEQDLEEEDLEEENNDGISDISEDQSEEESEGEVLLLEDFVDSTAGSNATKDDYVLVRFKKLGSKNNFVFYVGKILEVRETEVSVTFLRKKRQSFVFPNVADESDVSKEDIKKVLPEPSFRRGYYDFKIEFPVDITLN